MSASGTSVLSGCLKETSHRVTTFECGLQGINVEGDTPVSQDLVSFSVNAFMLSPAR